MHSKDSRRLTGIFLALALTAALGCGGAEPRAAAGGAPAEQETATSFDAASAGTITGNVTWKGAVPSVVPFEIQASPFAGKALQLRHARPNPNAPLIDPLTKGVGNAVVFLRGVDPMVAKPWDHSAAVVEQKACQFSINQDNTLSHFGFVRRGGQVTMVSRDDTFYSLHADGAAFFTLTFPDPEQPLQRHLAKNGLVELTSAAGYYWMRGYLFVDDHPYYAHTEADGRFTLSGVPAGKYDVVCWMPNWTKARHERDPELGLITRWYFDPPLERKEAVSLRRGETRELRFELSAPPSPREARD